MKGNKNTKNGLDSMVVKRREWLAGEHWYVDVFISTLQRWETLISIQVLNPRRGVEKEMGKRDAGPVQGVLALAIEAPRRITHRPPGG